MANEKINFSLGDKSSQPVELLTFPGGIGLYRKVVNLDLNLDFNQGLSADVKIIGCSVQLGSNGDTFLDVLIPGSQNSQEFDLTIRWNSNSGVSFGGGAGLEVTLPVRANFPILKLNALHFIATPALNSDPNAAFKIPLEVSADISGSFLNVIDATVQRFGINAELSVAGANPLNGDPFGASIDIMPPAGAGLSLNIAGILNGGGFLSVNNELGVYSGNFTVNLLTFGVTAFLIINTRPSFSLLAILNADFRPVGLDIGFGFTINAIGGLMGLHRGADLEALRDGIRNNAVASLMFPANPIADAPKIFSDLSRFFPVIQNEFLIGPMLELGWGKPTGMITLSVGLIIEIPNLKFALPGIMKVLVPPGIDSAPLRIQVNLLGWVDFSQQFLGFDASLFDSRLVLYTLDGDMSARLRWGSNANFAITVGGFHPKYTPSADLQLGSLRRVSINLLPTSDNPRLRIDSYYAATSNTLQHGARIELFAEALGFGLKGFLGYDLLVQLSPLYFDASFGGMVAIIAFDEEIMSLRLDLRFQGPSPFHIDGEVSFEFGIIITASITIPVHATFGSEDSPALPDVDVANKFREQLKNPRNWTAQLPSQNQLLVQLAPKLAIADNEVLAHPSSSLEFNQHTLPLGEVISRFGAAKPAKENTFDLLELSTSKGILKVDNLPVKSEFAPAQFFELSKDDQISAPSFVNLKSGLKADGASLVSFSKASKYDYGFEPHVIDKVAKDDDAPFIKFFLSDLNRSAALELLKGSALTKSDLYQERVANLPTGNEIKMASGGYRIVDKSSLMPIADMGVIDNHIAANRIHSEILAKSPELSGRLMVIPEHDLV
jgi:hypothetical protein